MPTEKFHETGYFEGFKSDVSQLTELLKPENMMFKPRSEMETDPTYKQLIPYVIFKWQGMLFQYRRGGGQGESRLHSKYSLGIGGHISQQDDTVEADPLTAGAFREISEEVEIHGKWNLSAIGLVNDDSTEVGKVHLGVVLGCELSLPAVKAREEGIEDAKFIRAGLLADRMEEFETWSQLCFKSLYGGNNGV